MVLGLDSGPLETVYNMLWCGKVWIPYTEGNDINTLGLNLLFEPIELGEQVGGQKGQSSGSLDLHLRGKTSEKPELTGN